MAPHPPASHGDSLGPASDPRWRIPTHSQQHPSDSSYQPTDSAEPSASTARASDTSSASVNVASTSSGADSLQIVASRAGEYCVVPRLQQGSAADTSSSDAAEWILKSQATPAMVDAWRTVRREQRRTRDGAAAGEDRKRKRASADSSESDQGPDSEAAARHGATSARPPPKRTSHDRPTSLTDTEGEASNAIYVDIPYASQHGRFVPYLSMTQSTANNDDAPADTQGPDSSSLDVPSTNTGEMSTDMQPLRVIPTETFAPYLDDDTGIELDAAGRPLARLPRAPAQPQREMESRQRDEEDVVPTQDRSSPVDQFSQSVSPPLLGPPPRSPSPPYRPDQVPRVGSWIVPKPPIRLASPAALHGSPPRPSTQPQVDFETQLDGLDLTQQLDSDEDLDFAEGEDRVPRLLEELERRKAANARRAALLSQHSVGSGAHSPPQGQGTLPVSQPSGYLSARGSLMTGEDEVGGEEEQQPLESTPPPAARSNGSEAGPNVGAAEAAPRRAPLPSQTIASQPPPPPGTASAEAVAISSVDETPRRPAPSAPAISSSQPHPASHRQALHGSDLSSSTNSPSSSQGWSTLPRREICELVHRSVHVPPFLKDEVEKYVTRSKRAATSQRSNMSGGAGGDAASQSQQPPPASQSQDDSETQEDGFLRIKKVWCFDLLRGGSDDSASAPPAMMGGGSQVVARFSQSQLSGAALSGSGSVIRRTIILLLDTVEGTFDVQEVEETLAAILRADKRFSPWFDGEGKPFPSAPSVPPREVVVQPPPPPPPAATETEKDERLAALQTEVERLRASLARAEGEVDRLRSTVSEHESQVSFLKTLYDQASTSSSQYRAQADEQAGQIATLRSQLTEGLATHRAMAAGAQTRDRLRIEMAEKQLALLVRQNEETNDKVRRKAAMWDAAREEERMRKQAEEERRRRVKAKREELQRQLGGVGGGGGEAVAYPVFGEVGAVPPPPPPPTLTHAEGEEEEQGIEDELQALHDEMLLAGEVVAPSPPPEGGRSRRSSRRTRVRPASTAPAAAPPPTQEVTQPALDIAAADLVRQTQDEVSEQLDLFVSHSDDLVASSNPSTAVTAGREEEEDRSGLITQP